MDDITKETIDSLRMRIDELENRLGSGRPGKSSLFHKVLDRKKLVAFVVVALALLVCITVAYAGTVTKPYNFSYGTPISAAQINANFDTLYDLVNGNLTGDNIYSVPASAIVGDVPVAEHGNASHSTKLVSKFSLKVSVNPPTVLDADTHYYASVPIDVPAAFDLGAVDWTRCLSAITLDAVLAPQDLTVASATMVSDAGVNKLKFRLVDSAANDYRLSSGVWATRTVIVTIAVPACE